MISGCGKQPATVHPNASEIAGRYTTKDSRAPAAVIDLRADGTFTLANWPDVNGSGYWEIQLDDSTHTFDFNLMFTTPSNYSIGGYELLGGPGNYSLGFFIGDPDDGAIVLERQKP